MKQKYKLIFAVAAAVASILFIVLAGQIYPHFYLGAADAEGNLDFFRQDLIDRGMTMPLALATVCIPWVAAVIYYYAINSVHFDRWWHWLMVLVITALLTSYADWQYMNAKFIIEDLSDIYSPYMLAMSGWNAVCAACVFIVASFGIRWWSNNCRHTPIPQ